MPHKKSHHSRPEERFTLNDDVNDDDQHDDDGDSDDDAKNTTTNLAARTLRE